MISIRRMCRCFVAIAIISLAAAALAGAAEKSKPEKPASEAPKPEIHKPAVVPVNPYAWQTLERACKVLSSAKAFSYRAEINFDSVLPSDVKLQYAASMAVALKRPNHLAIDYVSDLGAKRVWYNGKTLTVLDRAHMTYATVTAPDTIDAMFEQFAKDKHVSVPLEGFDFSQPCERIRPNLIHGTYVGLGDVNGVECDHLAFMVKNADWQIWIDRNKRPLARKIVITYTALPAAPQFSALLSHWNFHPDFPAALFTPQIPKKALRIKFMELKTPEEKHK